MTQVMKVKLSTPRPSRSRTSAGRQTFTWFSAECGHRWPRPPRTSAPLPPLHLQHRADSVAGTMLKRTPLHEFHASRGGKLVDFAGWEMPILYRGIVAEHAQTRNSGSIFDVSHMG